MKDFLIANVFWITALLVIVVFIPVYLALTKQWSALKSYAYNIIIMLEKEIVGTKAGQERMNKAIDLIYTQAVPKWAQLFIPKSLMRKFLQMCFNEIKHLLTNKSIPPDNK